MGDGALVDVAWLASFYAGLPPREAALAFGSDYDLEPDDALCPRPGLAQQSERRLTIRSRSVAGGAWGLWTPAHEVGEVGRPSSDKALATACPACLRLPTAMG